MTARPAPAPSPRLPNLVIIGVTKAGTTSLFSYLAQHPDICGSRLKETEYFSDLQYEDGRLAPLETYQRHFRHCRSQTYVMEATPNYWYGGERVRNALEEVLDRPRYVVALRNPVDRFWSDYTYMTGKQLLPTELTAEEYFERCLAFRDAGTEFTRANRYYRTVSTGFYHRHLARWLERYPDRLRVVFFEAMVTQPAETVGGLVRWLDLDPSVVERMDFSERNQTISHRSARLQRLAYGVGHRTDGLLRRAPALKAVAAEAYYAVNRSGTRREKLDPGLRDRLAELYRPANVELADLLRRYGWTDLPAWLLG